MDSAFFEKHHKPTGSFPYVEFSNENLSCLSHYHEEIEIAYVDKGEARAYCERTEISLKSGDICVFMPGEIHGFCKGCENNIYIIKIKADSYVEKVSFDTLKPVRNKISAKDENYDEIAKIIFEMRLEYTEKKKGYEFAIRALKNKVLAYILRNVPLTEAERGRNLYLLNKVSKFVEENFAKKIKLDDVAEYCHLSKYYFAHVFKRLTGMVFSEYLALFRVEKSMILLRCTDENMTEIALECGFGSVRSFNRVFAENMKIAPLSYRKHCTKEMRQK